MDGSLGNNQIKIALEDEKNTTFWTPKGINCYKGIIFGLKNSKVTH